MSLKRVVLSEVPIQEQDVRLTEFLCWLQVEESQRPKAEEAAAALGALVLN